MELKKLTPKTDVTTRWLDPWISPVRYRQVRAFRKGTLNNHEITAIRAAHSKDLLICLIYSISKVVLYSLIGATLGIGTSSFFTATHLPSPQIAPITGLVGLALGLGIGVCTGICSVTKDAQDLKIALLGLVNPALAAEQALKIDSDRFWHKIVTLGCDDPVDRVMLGSFALLTMSFAVPIISISFATAVVVPIAALTPIVT